MKHKNDETSRDNVTHIKRLDIARIIHLKYFFQLKSTVFTVISAIFQGIALIW